MTKDFILNTRLTSAQAALFYLGQESFLIKYQEHYLLIDPYLSDYVDQNCCTETVKWQRKYPAPIFAEELDFIDYILCSHEHFDHADPWTLQTLARINPDAKFIIPSPMQDTILSYGVTQEQIIGANADQAISLNMFPSKTTAECCSESKITVIPIPSAHEELHTDAIGQYKELGYKILLGNLSIYHAGDCCIYNGLLKRISNADVMMLPINGRSYYKLQNDIIGNMTVEEAILLAKEGDAGMLIPMHYDLYEVNGINPAVFTDTLFQMNPRQKYHMFTPGERYIVMKD